jgi:hypothetical protein
MTLAGGPERERGEAAGGVTQRVGCGINGRRGSDWRARPVKMKRFMKFVVTLFRNHRFKN